MIQQTPNEMLDDLDFWATLFARMEKIGIESASEECDLSTIYWCIEQIITVIRNAGEFKANTYHFRGKDNMVVEIVFKATTYESDYDENGEPI